jgi:hypothetical protein
MLLRVVPRKPTIELLQCRGIESLPISTNHQPGILRRIWRPVRVIGEEFWTFTKGYLRFVKTGRTTLEDGVTLRRLFRKTNGRFNDVITWYHRLTRPPRRFDTTASFLGNFGPEELRYMVRRLDRDGYVVFDRLLDSVTCQGLIDFALRTPMRYLTVGGGDSSERICFDPDKPVAVKYDLEMQQIMENSLAQRVVSDPGLLTVAEAYFRTRAIHDIVAMWWSAPAVEASSAAAQMFHFDMDRIKFLKFFVYLTDVGPLNGPHVYIAGSHRRLPRGLCADRRLTDDEVYRHVPKQNVVEIVGPRGTVCAVDTRGLHKGKQLFEGNRLIFQVEFATSLFGYPYPPVLLNRHFSPDFMKAVQRYPDLVSLYKPNPVSAEIVLDQQAKTSVT